MPLASNIIKHNHPNANMYGCQPCPVCRRRSRVSYKKKGEERRSIECDDCGHKETCNEEESDA